jgi:hypothetical protein
VSFALQAIISIAMFLGGILSGLVIGNIRAAAPGEMIDPSVGLPVIIAPILFCLAIGILAQRRLDGSAMGAAFKLYSTFVFGFVIAYGYSTL